MTYDSNLGTFLQRDPVEEGTNLYEYVGDSPTDALDPFGLQVVTGPVSVTSIFTPSSPGGVTWQDNPYLLPTGSPPPSLYEPSQGWGFNSYFEKPLSLPISPAKGLQAMAEAAAARHRIPAPILKGLIKQESNWNPAARSPVGALGLTQLMPGTAKELGLVVNAQVDERLDPQKNLDAGARYLRTQFEKFYEGANDLERWRLALAAYNAGRGSVNRWLRTIGKVGVAGSAQWCEISPLAPKETQGYVRNILGEKGEAGGYSRQYGRP